MSVLAALLLAAPAFFGSGLFEEPAPAAGTDMSSTFARLTTCESCVAAGYGWCPLKGKCGGFANKECQGAASRQRRSSTPEAPKRKSSDAPRRQQRTSAPPGDMTQTFAKLRTCADCVGAGYGWCPLKRRCGGFANKVCGVGPEYTSSAPSPRNGHWEPKGRPAPTSAPEAPPVAEVPSAASPPPATMLYAGPASPPSLASRSKDEKVTVVAAVAASSAATTTSSAWAVHDALANATLDAANVMHLSNATLDAAVLATLPREVLVKQILQLHGALRLHSTRQ